MRIPLATSLLALALVASAAPAAVLTVDITDDELDGACVPTDCSLREALADALDNDEIQFALAGPPPWTIRLQSGLGALVVDLEIVITGPGRDDLVVSGDSDANGTPDLRVFVVEPTGALVATGMTLRDGRATSVTRKHGGCVLNRAGALFQDVRFENCRGWDAGLGQDGGDGGAIFSEPGTVLTVDGCEFLSNRGGTGGGTTSGTDQYSGGRGGAIAGAAFLDVYRSTFSGNRGGTGGQTVGPGGAGGAIAVLPGGVLRVEESTFEGNASGDGGRFGAGPHGPDAPGGAIQAEADATLNNVTLSGNTIGSTTNGLPAQGGGLHVAAGTTRLRNVTVAGNVANGAGGGIARSGGTLRVRNTVVGLNAGAGVNDDCITNSAAALVSEGFNVIGIDNGCAASFTATGDQTGTSASPLDPGLGPLAANGGPTETRALLAGSPAIDAGETPNCQAWDPVAAGDVDLLVDQRGEPRPVDGDGDTVAVCDPGAYEAPLGTGTQFLLTAALAGGGSGTVTSVPAGISCPGDCTESYPDGTPVTLTATADPGSVFTGWSGDCSGTGSCAVTMDQDRDVTATFEALFALDVTVLGPGSVTSAPPGIACPGDCSEDYQDGTLVTLTASPDPGALFTGWSGDCTGTGGCQVTMDQARSVTASFVDLYLLQVSIPGGGGTVTSVPAGIACPGDCSESFPDGTVVDLTATPSGGFQFLGWSGDCTGTGACSVTMDQARSVTATFQAIVPVWTLDVTVAGVGTGTVTSVPAGIACPGDCTEDYADGTVVTLTATPTGESYFVGWSGDCSGTGTCDVTLDQDRAATASFDTMPFLDGFESGDTSAWSGVVP